MSFITGLKFWKTPSRKIFAADKTQVRGKASRTSETTAWNTSCLPLETPSDLGPQHEAQEILAQLAKLKTEIEKIQLAMWVKSNTIPNAFREALSHAFRCKICQVTPFVPPVILARCCTNIIGCQKCVDTWYSGTNALTKNCPLCQHERGYAQTSTIHGFDEVAMELQTLFENTDKVSGSDGSTKDPQ